MKKVKILEFILLLIYVCLGSFGVLFSFTDTFHISYNRNVLYFGAVFCIAATVILYAIKKYKLFAAVAVGGIGNVILFAAGRKDVWKSVRLVMKAVFMRAEAYLEGQKAVGNAAAGGYDMGLLFFFILAGTVIAYGVVCCKRAWCTVAVMVFGIVIPFLVGNIPQNGPLACMIVVILGAGFSKMSGSGNKAVYKTGLLGITVGFFACIIGITAIQKPLKAVLDKDQPVQEAVYSFWEEKMKKFSGKDKGKGGVNSGELGNISEFEEDNSEHLKVTVNKRPESRIYLQGYIGTEYTGQKWKSDGRSSAYDMIPEMITSQYAMTVTNINANPAYKYRPNVREYEEFSGQFPGDMAAAESDYWLFVNDEYTEVPQNIQDAFSREVTEKVKGSDVNAVIEQVGAMLAAQTSYSTSPGKTPLGEDFAEYFYFKNKKGYCSHYATVATLLLRMKSIPTRYVAGYVVEPGEFRKHSDGGYVAVVTGESAHAWAEVYLPGIGWVPAETTPGYRSEVQTEERQEKQPQQQESQKPVPEEEEKVENPEVQEENKEKQNLPKEIEPLKEKETRKNIWGYIVTAAAGFGIICALAVRKRLNHKMQIYTEQKGYNAKIRKLFYQTFERLLAEKIVSKDIALDTVFIDKICEKYKEISRGDIEKMMNIVYYANFGKEDLGREEYQFVRRILLLLEKMK